jgi:hypothetical protein
MAADVCAPGARRQFRRPSDWRASPACRLWVRSRLEVTTTCLPFGDEHVYNRSVHPASGT